MKQWQKVLVAIADLTPTLETAPFFAVSPSIVITEKNRIRLLWQEERQNKIEFPTLNDLVQPAEEEATLSFPIFARKERQDVSALLPDDAAIRHFWQEAIKLACQQKKR